MELTLKEILDDVQDDEVDFYNEAGPYNMGYPRG
jgi:hypothetical protein